MKEGNNKNGWLVHRPFFIISSFNHILAFAQDGSSIFGLYCPFYVLAQLFQLELHPKLEALDRK